MHALAVARHLIPRRGRGVEDIGPRALVDRNVLLVPKLVAARPSKRMLVRCHYGPEDMRNVLAHSAAHAAVDGVVDERNMAHAEFLRRRGWRERSGHGRAYGGHQLLLPRILNCNIG